MKEKKVPMRTCLGCYTEKPKKELLRVVRTPDGAYFLDATGKMNGRGAYVCKDMNCMNAICKAHKLGKAFGEQPSQEVYDLIRKDMETVISSNGGNI